MAQKNLSFFELHYADGVKVGETYHSLDGINEEKIIGGSVRARQSFKMRDATRKVTGAWLNFGHTASADGSALKLQLKDVGGEVLASARLIASDPCIAEVRRGNSKCRDWHLAKFGMTVTLELGKRYELELSGSQQAGFVLSSYQPLIAHGYEDRNYWRDARAELSTDSGANWTEWSPQLGDHRDLGLLFTIEGMPTQLP